MLPGDLQNHTEGENNSQTMLIYSYKQNFFSHNSTGSKSSYMDVSRPKIRVSINSGTWNPLRVKVQEKPDFLRFLIDCRHEMPRCSRPPGKCLWI